MGAISVSGVSNQCQWWEQSVSVVGKLRSLVGLHEPLGGVPNEKQEEAAKEEAESSCQLIQQGWSTTWAVRLALCLPLPRSHSSQSTHMAISRT